MSEFKNLPFNTDTIAPVLERFFELNQDNGIRKRNDILINDGLRRIEFTQSGHKETATVDLHLLSNGKVTVQYKTGKNQQLGKSLANFILSSLDVHQGIAVSMTISGVDEEDLLPLMDEFKQTPSITIEQKEAKGTGQKFHWKITSQYGDHIIVQWWSTRRLGIQGAQLHAYKEFIYLISTLLDMQGLERVIIKEDAEQSKIVNTEIAKAAMKLFMPIAYAQMDSKLRSLILSGYCIRISSPKLPDYTLTLYPDLRALEWVLKETHQHLGLPIDSNPQRSKGFGEYYIHKGMNYSLRPTFVSEVTQTLADTLSEGYSLYNRERHTLFHAEDMPAASKTITNAEMAFDKSTEILNAIESIYRAR